MYKNLSKTKKILKRLQKEGKIRKLDSPDDIRKITEMNEYMKEVRQEFLYKEAMSEISASKVILNS